MSILGSPLLIGWSNLQLGSTIVVNSDVGAEILISYGPKSYTATVPMTGYVSFTIYTIGRWNITASKSGATPITDYIDVTQDNTTYTKEMLWRFYLYNEGVEETIVSGGLTTVPRWYINGHQNWYTGNPTIQRNEDNFVYTCGGYYVSCGIRTMSKIDLSNYAKLVLVMTEYSDSDPNVNNIIITDGMSGYITTLTAVSIVSGAGIYNVDLSSISGEHFVGLYYAGGYAGNFSSKITKIWLE